MKIIPANISHIADIQEIALKSWKITYADILSDEQFAYMVEMMYSDQSLLKQMTELQHHFLFIGDENSHRYEGFISYEHHYKNLPQTKIHKFYLLPESKGKGFGRILINEVMSAARSANDNYLTLNMHRENKSFGFYKKMGFTVDREENLDVGSGYLMEDYVLGRKVFSASNMCVLFDMDGVVIDTETQYDLFWKHTGDRYNVGIANFEKVIKGNTLPNILKKYFSHLTAEELSNLSDNLDQFEENMTFDEIPGAIRFIEMLKSKGFKVGLVTSSTDSKLMAVNKVRHLDRLFDTIVSAARVTEGKPNPQCFLLAAQDLGVSPDDCIVFEDSFAGIEAAKAAHMTVIGLSTTHPVDLLKDKCRRVIPNFDEFSLDKLLSV